MSKVIIIPLSSNGKCFNKYLQHPAYVAIPLTDDLKKRIKELSKLCNDFRLCECKDHLFGMHEKYINDNVLSKKAKDSLAIGECYITTQKWFDCVEECRERDFIEFMILSVEIDNCFKITGRQKFNGADITSFMLSLDDI